MASIIYKKIFEVRILHDYFLATEANSFFSPVLTDQDRAQILLDRYHLDIKNELLIQPTKSCVNIMRDYKLRFIQTPYGFFVAQEVEKVDQVGGAVFYKPLLPLESDKGLSFSMKSVNYLFNNYSGLPLKNNLPTIYYFDNKDDAGDKTFPILSVPAPDYSPTATYEMGAQTINAGTLIEAVIENTNDLTAWQNVDGSGFVNSSDNALLPRQFYVNFPQLTLPAVVEASLSEPGGGPLVKSISVPVKSDGPFSLDFCNNPVDDCIEDGRYDLVITDGTDTLLERSILINNDLYDKYMMGVVEIFPSIGTDYELMDASGFIIARINADQTKNSHPIFEIRLRSRLSYWRYKSSEAFPVADINDTNPVLDVEPGTGDTVMVSINPETLLNGFNKTLGIIGLPNPGPEHLKYGTDGKIYSDIYISSINRLLNN